MLFISLASDRWERSPRLFVQAWPKEISAYIADVVTPLSLPLLQPKWADLFLAAMKDRTTVMPWSKADLSRFHYMKLRRCATRVVATEAMRGDRSVRGQGKQRREDGLGSSVKENKSRELQRQKGKDKKKKRKKFSN